MLLVFRALQLQRLNCRMSQDAAVFVSYEIVRSHHGEIRVESQPREGAVFEVRLPSAPAPELGSTS